MSRFSLATPSENQIKAVKKALERARRILDQSTAEVNYDEVHSVKSTLYAAIEQVGMRAERLFSAQRMLRELFAIVTTKADLREYEKGAGIQIIKELYERYGIDLIGTDI